MPLDHGCFKQRPCGSMEERLTTDQAVAGSSPATDALLVPLRRKSEGSAGNRTLDLSHPKRESCH